MSSLEPRKAKTQPEPKRVPGMHAQRSFNRFGMDLEGRSIKIVGNVRPGYAEKHLTGIFMREKAEAVLIERDPDNVGKFLVSALFPPSSAPTLKK